MSEHLQTYTERRRDQRRIEALEAELGRAKDCLKEINGRHDEVLRHYSHVCNALGEAREWRSVAVMMALAGGFLAIFAIRAFGL